MIASYRRCLGKNFLKSCSRCSIESSPRSAKPQSESRPTALGWELHAGKFEGAATICTFHFVVPTSTSAQSARRSPIQICRRVEGQSLAARHRLFATRKINHRQSLCETNFIFSESDSWNHQMVCLAVRRAGSGESRKTIEEARRRGSQVNMQKKIPAGTITVPVPDHAEIRIGTLQSIIRHPTFQEASLKSDLIGNCRMLETIKVHVTESFDEPSPVRIKELLSACRLLHSRCQ